ncbi:MAG: YceI family protein [Lysobacter sp.]|nr:YceI family protein [Lysobacter sp.]
MRRTLLLAALLATAGIATASPTRYDLDPNHTQVRFGWTHFGFSHQAGRFDKVDAQFRFDPADPTKSSVAVTIPVASIDTGVPALDEHLRSSDFLDAAKYPTATFKSTHVETAGPKALKVTGDLTLHGVTKPVVLDVTINQVGPYPMGPAGGRPAAGFDATATIKRSAFGIDKYVPNVSDDITLSITTETHVPKDDGAPAK